MSTLFDPPAATNDGLPPLRGTERQLPWATEIRARKLAAVRKLLRDWRLLIESHEQAGRTAAATREREGYREAIDGAERLEQQTECRFWIDRRDNSALELVKGADAKPGGSW